MELQNKTFEKLLEMNVNILRKHKRKQFMWAVLWGSQWPSDRTNSDALISVAQSWPSGGWITYKKNGILLFKNNSTKTDITSSIYKMGAFGPTYVYVIIIQNNSCYNLINSCTIHDMYDCDYMTMKEINIIFVCLIIWSITDKLIKTYLCFPLTCL